MKSVLAAILGAALLLTACPAPAYVVTVTTSISAQSLANDTDLKAALRWAVDDVLKNVIAFSPTFLTVETTRIVGDRLYITLVIGDGEGEATMDALSAGRGPGID